MYPSLPQGVSIGPIIDKEFNFSNNTFAFSHNTLINSDFSLLIDYINGREYQKVEEIMTSLKNNTKAFYSTDMKTELLKLVTSYLTIRKTVQIGYKKVRKVAVRVNELNLSLSTILPNKSIDVTIDNSIYSFDVNELLKIYRYSLHSINNSLYLNGELNPPRNPYTNLCFSLRENIIIYDKFKDYYISIGRALPVYLEKFKSVYFDIELYRRYNFDSLMSKSVASYIGELSQAEFKTEFKTMIASSMYTKDNYCRHCYKKRELVKLFSKIIELYILNSNNIFIFGCYTTEFRIILEKNKTVFGRSHIKQHRKIFWKANIKRFNFITAAASEPPLESHPMAI